MKEPFKICFIVSDVDRWVHFEWLTDSLIKRKISFCFILINDGPSELESFLTSRNIELTRIGPPNILMAPFYILKLAKVIRRTQANIVHTHFLWASLYGLMSAKLAGIRHRIQTRHHSDFHIQNHPKGVLYDKLNDKVATHIIVPTQIIKELMVKHEAADANKITVIPHGFVFDEFIKPDLKNVEKLRQNYSLSPQDFVVGAASRFIKPKSVSHIVSAFKIFSQQKENAVLFLANARGPEKEQIMKELSGLPKDRYRVVEFEKDLFSLFQLFNAFVHIPSRPTAESFGQVYVESLASAVPSIFTRAGVATDHFKDQEEAIIIPAESSEDIVKALNRIYDKPMEAKEMAERGRSYVLKHFGFEQMIDSYIDLYQRLSRQ